MSFGYRILKSFSRTPGRNRSENVVKQAANAGVCTLPSSRLHEYNGSNDGRFRMHPVPLSASSRGTLHIYFSKLHLRDGAFSYVKLPFVSRKFVVLNSAELARTVLSMRSTDGRLGLFLQDHVLENKGFSFQDLGEREDRHKRFLKTFLCQRAKSLEMFLKEETGKISEQVCQTHIDCNFDVQLQQIMCAVFSKLLIGEALPADDPDKDALWEFIERLYDLLQPAVDLPLRMFPWLRFLPFKHGRLFRAAIESRDRVSRKYFDTQKATYEAGRVRGLVDVCLQIQAEGGTTSGDQAWLSDDYIRGLMFDTVLAGMSEMMKSMRMLILLMCHYPHVQSRVHAEIYDVIGTSAMPSSNHRTEMPYTQAVLLEMLRYVSQTPLAIPHKCNKDVVLDGFVIEKDSGIFPNIFGIHHDEAIWGDPWCFRPERFLTHDGYSLLPEDHKLRQSLIPFSVGRRRCPGEDFAMTRLFLVLTSLIQKLHFLPPSSGELPSADPRLYNNQYPLYLPVFTCKAVRRPVMDAQTESQS